MPQPGSAAQHSSLSGQSGRHMVPQGLGSLPWTPQAASGPGPSPYRQVRRRGGGPRRHRERRGRWGPALAPGHGSLEKAQLRDGPIAEIHVHPLQNLLGTVLQLDGAGAVDLEHENRTVVPPGALGRGRLPILDPPRPDELVRRGEARQLLADDRWPFAQERGDGEAARPRDGIEHARHIGADGAWRRSLP